MEIQEGDRVAWTMIHYRRVFNRHAQRRETRRYEKPKTGRVDAIIGDEAMILPDGNIKRVWVRLKDLKKIQNP